MERLIRSGHTEVVDADLSGYFDSERDDDAIMPPAGRIRLTFWVTPLVGQPRPPSGAPLVVREVQGAGSWKETIPCRTPVPGAGITPAPTNVDTAPIVRGRTCDEEYQYSLVRRPGAGKPHAGFDERDVKTESW